MLERHDLPRQAPDQAHPVQAVQREDNDQRQDQALRGPPQGRTWGCHDPRIGRPTATRRGEPSWTYSTVMRFEVGAFFFGSASDSTPLSIFALTLDSSISEANVKLRATEP